MDQINLQQDDTLYVLGDVADRFPDGIAILRELMGMPNVKMLLGNRRFPDHRAERRRVYAGGRRGCSHHPVHKVQLLHCLNG